METCLTEVFSHSSGVLHILFSRGEWCWCAFHAIVINSLDSFAFSSNQDCYSFHVNDRVGPFGHGCGLVPMFANVSMLSLLVKSIADHHVFFLFTLRSVKTAVVALLCLIKTFVCFI